MWPAKKDPQGILYLAITARHIEGAVRCEGDWLSETRLRAEIDQSLSLDTATESVSKTLGLWQVLLQQALSRSATKVSIVEIRVVVADSWLNQVCIPWSSALQEPLAAHAYMRSQLMLAACEWHDGDTIRSDDAAFGMPRLIVSYPAGLLAALTLLATNLKSSLGSVLPLSTAAWRQKKKTGGSRVLALLDDDWMLIAQGARRVTDVQVRTGFGEEDTSSSLIPALVSQWKRMRLRDSRLQDVERLQVLALRPNLRRAGEAVSEIEWMILPAQQTGSIVSVPVQLAQLASQSCLALDAIPIVQARGRRYRLLAAVTLIFAAAMGALAWQSSTRLRAVEARLIAQRKVPSAVMKAPRWSKEEAARIQAVNSAIREMNLPIGALMAALQAPREIQVALLSVDFSRPGASEQSVARIQAEARTGADMARYVSFLSDRAPFSGAYLTRHEIAVTEPEQPYRFTVEVSWRD